MIALDKIVSNTIFWLRVFSASRQNPLRLTVPRIKRAGLSHSGRSPSGDDDANRWAASFLIQIIF